MLKSFTRGPDGGGLSGLSLTTLAIGAGVLLAVVLAYRDVWPWLLTEWRDNPYYSHGVLVPLLSLFLLWRARDALARRHPSNWGYPVIAAGLVMLVVGLWVSAYWIAGFSLPVVITRVAIALTSQHGAHRGVAGGRECLGHRRRDELLPRLLELRVLRTRARAPIPRQRRSAMSIVAAAARPAAIVGLLVLAIAGTALVTTARQDKQ